MVDNIEANQYTNMGSENWMNCNHKPSYTA